MVIMCYYSYFFYFFCSILVLTMQRWRARSLFRRLDLCSSHYVVFAILKFYLPNEFPKSF